MFVRRFLCFSPLDHCVFPNMEELGLVGECIRYGQPRFHAGNKNNMNDSTNGSSTEEKQWSFAPTAGNGNPVAPLLAIVRKLIKIPKKNSYFHSQPQGKVLLLPFFLLDPGNFFNGECVRRWMRFLLSFPPGMSLCSLEQSNTCLSQQATVDRYIPLKVERRNHEQKVLMHQLQSPYTPPMRLTPLCVTY